MSKIGQKLQETRIKKGYKSANDFCSKNNYPLTKYTNYEQGRCRMPIDEAAKIAKLLNCSLDTLCGTFSSSSLSNSEVRLVAAYNNAPANIKEAINLILKDYYSLTNNH